MPLFYRLASPRATEESITRQPPSHPARSHSHFSRPIRPGLTDAQSPKTPPSPSPVWSSSLPADLDLLSLPHLAYAVCPPEVGGTTQLVSWMSIAQRVAALALRGALGSGEVEADASRPSVEPAGARRGTHARVCVSIARGGGVASLLPYSTSYLASATASSPTASDPAQLQSPSGRPARKQSASGLGPARRRSAM